MKPVMFLLALILSIGSSFANSIRFESLADGQIRATGSNFTRSATNNKQVNVYKNGQFLNQIYLNGNGSFSYTSPKHSFRNQDQITVKVLQYYSQQSHFEKSGAYYYTGDYGGYHSLDFSSLSNGQMRVVGKNFTNSQTHNRQVNFYKNGKFIGEIYMNPNGSFSYTTPQHTFINGDQFTVKVLQYLGHSHHYEKTATYRGQYNENGDYVTSCYRYARTYSNQELCIRLRVPAHVSQACGTYARTYENEAVCLRSQTRPENARACGQYMRTFENEAVCLSNRRLTVNQIISCSSAYTYADERRCVQNAY